jgi:hypothetical protein
VGGGIATILVAELLTRGIAARVAETIPATADAVIFLGGLRSVTTEAEAQGINREAFRAAHAAAPGFSDRGGLFVTVQDTGGAFALTEGDPVRAHLAGLPALVRAASLEWPKATVAAIDLERGGRAPDTLARILVDELLFGGNELAVGLSASGSRRALRPVPAVLPSDPGLLGRATAA